MPATRADARLGDRQRIRQVSGEVLQVGQSALYPALHKLEQQGWITAEWDVSENNRRAKLLHADPRGPEGTRAREPPVGAPVGGDLARSAQRLSTAARLRVVRLRLRSLHLRDVARRRARRGAADITSSPITRTSPRGHGAARCAAGRAQGNGRPRATQRGVSRHARIDPAQSPATGRELRRQAAARAPGVHLYRNAHAGPRDVRERQHLRVRRCTLSKPLPYRTAVAPRRRVRTGGPVPAGATCRTRTISTGNGRTQCSPRSRFTTARCSCFGGRPAPSPRAARACPTASSASSVCDPHWAATSAAGEDLPSGPRVVMLSYGAWQNRYGAQGRRSGPCRLARRTPVR